MFEWGRYCPSHCCDLSTCSKRQYPPFLHRPVPVSKLKTNSLTTDIRLDFLLRRSCFWMLHKTHHWASVGHCSPSFRGRLCRLCCHWTFAEVEFSSFSRTVYPFAQLWIFACAISTAFGCVKKSTVIMGDIFATRVS